MTHAASEHQPVPAVDDHRVALIRGLRACADFLTQHPTVKVPLDVGLNVFVQTKDELAAHARVTSWDKDYLGDFFFLTKSFGPVKLQINVNREVVCMRIVVGTRQEPAKTVEVVEWRCEDAALLAPQG